MSINLSYAMNHEKMTKKYGPLFSTIDFECNSQVTKQTLQAKGENTYAGQFCIAGNKFNVSLRELSDIAEATLQGKCVIAGQKFDLTPVEQDRIVETCTLARQVFFQRYRFGM